MDEEELEQSGKKITIGNFFDSIVRIDRLADRAFKTSSTNVILTRQNSSLIKALESSFREMFRPIKLILEMLSPCPGKISSAPSSAICVTV